jgi:hypothetical protein
MPFVPSENGGGITRRSKFQGTFRIEEQTQMTSDPLPEIKRGNFSNTLILSADFSRRKKWKKLRNA